MTSPTEKHRSNSYPPDFISATTLIAIGLIFLFQNLGILPGNFWFKLLRLWPLLLIFSGIQLIFTRSRITSFLLSLVYLATIISLIYPALDVDKLNNQFNTNLPSLDLNNFGSNSNFTTKQQSVKLSEFDKEKIDIININLTQPLASLSLLDRSASDYITHKSHGPFKQEITSELKDQTLQITIFSNKDYNPFSKSPKHTLYLGQHQIPTSITTDLSVGKQDISFDDQVLKKLDLSTGVGSIELTLSAVSLGSAQILIDISIGSANLYLPDDRNFNVQADVGLGSFTVNGNNIKSDSYSHHPEMSVTPATIRVKIGLGTLNITTQ